MQTLRRAWTKWRRERAGTHPGRKRTGKDIIARMIHGGLRENRAIREVNSQHSRNVCGSELFRVRERAFTGAYGMKRDAEMAHRGTLFLTKFRTRSCAAIEAAAAATRRAVLPHRPQEDKKVKCGSCARPTASWKMKIENGTLAGSVLPASMF